MRSIAILAALVSRAALTPNRTLAGPASGNGTTNYNCQGNGTWPCIDSISSSGDGSAITMHWITAQFSAYDFFQVRFAGPGISMTQVKLGGGTEGSYTVIVVQAGASGPYTLMVQACLAEQLQPANCTGWNSEQYVIPPPTTGTSSSGLSTSASAAAANASGYHAGDTFGTTAPGTCLAGYVWRQVNASDHVCVTPQSRQEIVNDDAAAGPRTDMRPVARGKGPHPCVQGYVWRMAIANDAVCVTPQDHDQAMQDN